MAEGALLTTSPRQGKCDGAVSPVLDHRVVVPAEEDPAAVTSGTPSAGRLALVPARIPRDALGMAMPQRADGDEVLIDDLLAGVRTTAELNQMIREGLAAARRGETMDPGSFARHAGEDFLTNREPA